MHTARPIATLADLATLEQNPVYAALPAFPSDSVHDDEAMALLDIIEERFS